MVLDPVTGFNPETLSVVVVNLSQCYLDSMNDIDKVGNAVFASSSFVIAANHSHLTPNRTMLPAVEGVLGLVAFSSRE